MTSAHDLVWAQYVGRRVTVRVRETRDSPVYTATLLGVRYGDDAVLVLVGVKGRDPVWLSARRLVGIEQRATVAGKSETPA